MSLFKRKNPQEVRAHIDKLLSNSKDGRRLDSRIKHVLVGMVVPIVNRRPQISEAFAATTKDFSSHGVGMVFQKPDAPAEAMLGFFINAQMVYFRGEFKHSEPIGGGFFSHGFELYEVVSPGEYPELAALTL
jgi:hypothetical protein